ncbi:hypothetical protein KIL84_002598 [Mauremys mutica]|uniref:Uncharacterized protein n=1 Tax=Mauremys mutica TaxID=74926 RepID=A0A9D3X5Y4_9SAUR|nr:hypothetical protein KIL84_002598 [Mauremys mutica]
MTSVATSRQATSRTCAHAAPPSKPHNLGEGQHPAPLLKGKLRHRVSLACQSDRAAQVQSKEQNSGPLVQNPACQLQSAGLAGHPALGTSLSVGGDATTGAVHSQASAPGRSRSALVRAALNTPTPAPASVSPPRAGAMC